MEAFEECGISIDFYNLRQRTAEEILPWDFIDCGISWLFSDILPSDTWKPTEKV